MAEAEKEVSEIKNRMHAKGAADSVAIKHRAQSAAELEARKMRLAAKQEAIRQAMDIAACHLSNMEPKDYIPFLVKKIAAAQVMKAQILLNERDRATIGKKLVTAANKSLKGGELALSDQTIDAKGGFILKYGATEINSTLETIVESVKDAVTPEVLSALFRE